MSESGILVSLLLTPYFHHLVQLGVYVEHWVLSVFDQISHNHFREYSLYDKTHVLCV